MYNPDKSAELKEKFKKLSAEEQTNTLALSMQKAIVSFMGGAVRTLALGSIAYVALNAIVSRTTVAPFSWLEAVALYGSFEILVGTVKRVRG
jgi:hypothetical protein